MNEATFGWKWVRYCLLKRTHLAETGFFFTVQVCNDVFQKDEGVVLGKKLFISVSKVYKDENFLDFAKLHFWWKKTQRWSLMLFDTQPIAKLPPKSIMRYSFFKKPSTRTYAYLRGLFFRCILQQLSFNMVIIWWQEWRKSALLKVFAIRENVDKSNY